MAIDPRHLRILRLIAEHGSFSKAAEAQHISQPALSSSIAQMERYLGVRVLDRGRNGATVNKFGEVLLRHARGLEASLFSAEEEVRLRRLGLEGPLNVGGTPVALLTLVPIALSLMEGRVGMLSASVSEADDDQLIQKLRLGTIDIVVNTVGMDPSLPDIEEEALLKVPFDVVVNVRNPLAQAASLDLSELEGMQWILPTPGGSFRRQIEALFVTAGIKLPAAVLTCGSFTAYREVLRNTNYVSILPRHVVGLEVKAGVLKSIPLRNKAMSRHIGMRTLRSRQPSPIGQLFMAALREASKTL
jgi:LysR family transcriptional regulator, regulator for genes of the gallate degradation pathway